MCRSLLCLVATLCFASIALADATIDDFESYFDNPGIQAVWSDGSDGTSTATPTLLSSGAGGTYQSMQVAYNCAAGWAQPDNPTNYDNASDFAAVGASFAPITWDAGGVVKMYVRTEGLDMTKVGQFIISFESDVGYQQMWLPAPTWSSMWVQWGWNPNRAPATFGELPNMGGNAGWFPPLMTVVRDGQDWLEITITETCLTTWGPIGASSWVGHTISGINLELWNTGVTDSSGASGGPKIDGTDTVWPHGPLTGNVFFDEIRYIAPEPATIAMLGLGALALIRRKK
jgi:hypothetical protein